MNISFLQSEIGTCRREDAFFHIIQAPFEATVSYGGGTARACDAIIQSSQQLELCDGYSVPADCGIHTCAPHDAAASVDEVLDFVGREVETSLLASACPVIIGGEHTVSCGAFAAIARMGRKCGIIQFDAHADLRDTYQDTPYSHACVMRRAHDIALPFFQIGTRSYSPEEAVFRRDENIPFYDASASYDDLVLPVSLPDTVYLTIDIDVFDGLLMPATGTPEPGGINWFQFFAIIETIARQKRIIGFDLVEFSPIEGMHAYDYFCARLIYNIMGVIQRASCL